MFSNTSLLFLIMHITLFLQLSIIFFSCPLHNQGYTNSTESVGHRPMVLHGYRLPRMQVLQKKICCLVQCGTWSTVPGPSELLSSTTHIQVPVKHKVVNLS